MTEHKDRNPGKRPTRDGLKTSLLERLWHRHPPRANEHPQQPEQQAECIRRDLEMLLNTRVLRHGASAGLRHVRHSIVNYGITDIAARPLHSEQQREDFARELATAIARFEPRLRNVCVSTAIGQQRQHRFRIDAVLVVGTAMETVSFESELERSTASMRVSQVFP